ncbi:GNAT family N-acetyltransferase [Promicromonospora panici]|uniref:GNAT family N-acetyltransferase n=1 Tax=Promicromonospora panici TaxID=2219658 RepID=UPI00101CB6F6|nr:GNAT family N-acetyltransferase [Promicromonospora panici]
MEYLPQATPWIVGMVVHPGFRRRQVGAALLGRLERWAVDLRSERIWVATGREPAVRFYQSCGWDVDEDAEAASGHRASVLVKAVAT